MHTADRATLHQGDSRGIDGGNSDLGRSVHVATSGIGDLDTDDSAVIWIGGISFNDRLGLGLLPAPQIAWHVDRYQGGFVGIKTSASSKDINLGDSKIPGGSDCGQARASIEISGHLDIDPSQVNCPILCGNSALGQDPAGGDGIPCHDADIKGAGLLGGGGSGGDRCPQGNVPKRPQPQCAHPAERLRANQLNRGIDRQRIAPVSGAGGSAGGLHLDGVCVDTAQLVVQKLERRSRSRAAFGSQNHIPGEQISVGIHRPAVQRRPGVRLEHHCLLLLSALAEKGVDPAVEHDVVGGHHHATHIRLVVVVSNGDRGAEILVENSIGVSSRRVDQGVAVPHGD